MKRKPIKPYVLGLDIGASKICAVICEIDRDHQYEVKAIGTSITSGFEKGVIVSINELKKSIQRAIQRVQHTAGVLPTEVVANVPMHRMYFLHSSATLSSSEECGQISEQDRISCIKNASLIPTEKTLRLLHMIPSEYRVDYTVVQNPVGVFGQRLEVDTHLLFAQNDIIVKMAKILKELGFHVSGLMYDGLASAQILTTEDERREGIATLDIGGRYTRLNIFRNGQLQHTVSIPIGGMSITSDIAQCLKISMEEAERIKIIHGQAACDRKTIDNKIEILVDTEFKSEITKGYLCQIIQARIMELCNLLKRDIVFDWSDIPEIVLFGGGGLMKEMPHLIQYSLNKPVRLGSPQHRKHMLDSLSSIVALGVIDYSLAHKAIAFKFEKKLDFAQLFSKLFWDYFQ